MKVKTLLLLLVLITFTGCRHLIPKQVEFGQDKIEKFPVAKPAQIELERQTALRAAEKSEETLLAALVEQASPAVTQPAKEASILTDSVSRSLGPPLNPSTAPSAVLARKLDQSVAKLNERLEDFRKDNDKNVGKKIEDTGIFKIGYFSMWLAILVVLALIWAGVKIYGIFNPVVGAGANVVGRVSSTVVHRALNEVAEGGEKFKAFLKKSEVPEEVKSRVMEIFQEAHERTQSRDVQTLVKRLTETK